MKYVYVCERCGMQFNDMDEAYKCERSHRTAEMLDAYILDEATRRKISYGELNLQEYDPQVQLPSKIWVKVAQIDEDGSYMTDDAGHVVYDVMMYKLAESSMQSRKARELKEAIVKGIQESDERIKQIARERAERGED